MAGDSSSAGHVCYRCNEITATYKTGWRLRSGDLAKLCERCGSAYANGTFCEIFHLDSDGWRDCSHCQKMLHCGCIMSRERIIELDFGGISCVECLNKRQSMTNIENTSSKACLGSHSGESHPKVELSVESEEPMTETNTGDDPVSSAGLAVTLALSPEKDVKLVTPGSPYSPSNSLSETYSSSESDADSVRCHVISSGLIYSLHHPKMSMGENLKFLGDSRSGIIPLFEKVLTASDTDIKKPRLVIPKKYAKAYFPEILDPMGMKLEVQDMTGKNWELNYRCWLNTHSKMYVLEGLKDYMILMQWQPSDIVTFSLIQLEGKLLMGTRKASASLPASECGGLPRGAAIDKESSFRFAHHEKCLDEVELTLLRAGNKEEPISTWFGVTEVRACVALSRQETKLLPCMLSSEKLIIPQILRQLYSHDGF